MNPQHPKVRQSKPDRVIDGHSFWFVKELDEVLHQRYALAEIQMIYLRSGISQPFLREMMQTLIDRALNFKNPDTFRGEVIAVAQNIQGRIDYIAEQKAYEELACVLTLMDDEPDTYLPEYQLKKKAVWSKDAKDRDFFLFRAFRLVNDLNEISEKDITAVWQAVSERINQLTLQLKSQDLLKNETT